MKNKKFVSITVCLLLAVLAGFVGPQSVDSKIITSVEADISGEELKALVIEDFEEVKPGKEGWNVITTPKQFDDKKLDDDKRKKRNPVEKLELKMIQGKPNDMIGEAWSLTKKGDTEKTKNCMGVNFKFKYPGHNSVHLLAPPELSWDEKKPVMTYNPATRSNVQERGVQLPGRAKAISVWVHGRGNPYDLEVWVKDYRGSTHILKMGSVNFVGWRPIKVDIPEWIPQATESYPITRVSKITRFVLRADVHVPRAELTENTYFFFDQLKVLTDVYEVNYDGHKLHDQFGDGGGTSAKPATETGP
ncbi:MAG: hypothetical protein GY754_11765 [bacterium]|nr:hypothetical protein [bacterium]